MGVRLKRFTGKVKPFFSLDGLGITIKYGEVVCLEDWQINHPSFKFADNNGWVVSVDRRTLVFNPVPSQQSSQTPKKEVKKSISSPIDLPEKGLDPSIIHQILEKQDVFVKQAQKTIDRLSKKEPEAPSVSPELINTLIENQKKMMEMLLAKETVKPTPPPSDQTPVLQALKLLTNEVKRLQESKSTEPALDTNQLLEGVKQVISQYSPSQSYNDKKKDSSGFQIQDNFEEKFVPKVEDFDVKNSKIVAQEQDSGSVEEALAALRKLKGKK